MSITTFEDPAKGELRAACEVAIDQAGYQLATSLQRVQMPAGLNGALVGDLQSLDGQDRRTFYYLRVAADGVLPKWLASIARASHQLRAGAMYVVVRDYAPGFRKSCEAAGAGLLRITSDNVFEVVVDYDSVAPIDPDVALNSKLSVLRRALEQKLDLQRRAIELRYDRVAQLVAEMDTAAADSYMGRVEADYRALDEWAEQLSKRLDALDSDSSEAAMEAVRIDIENGPAGLARTA